MWSLCRKNGKFYTYEWIDIPSSLGKECQLNVALLHFLAITIKQKAWKLFLAVFNITRLCNICRMQRESCSHVRNPHVKVFLFWGGAAQPLVGQGLVVIEDSRSHSDTPQSVDILWTTYQPDLTTLNTQKRHTSVSLTGFEPAFPASKRPQTHALDRLATGISLTYNCELQFFRGKPQLISLCFWV